MTKVLDKQTAIVVLFKALKAKFRKEWAKILQQVIRDSCKSVKSKFEEKPIGVRVKKKQN